MTGALGGTTEKQHEMGPPANNHALEMGEQDSAASRSQQAVSQDSPWLITSVSNIETFFLPSLGQNSVEYKNYK
ncbi:hypothetical protein DFQ26_008483 [Actinomortierella ambigua]|nr:hypothetical protein DFQ26_008483 [Actinomortierella ambigua]